MPGPLPDAQAWFTCLQAVSSSLGPPRMPRSGRSFVRETLRWGRGKPAQYGTGHSCPPTPPSFTLFHRTLTINMWRQWLESRGRKVNL